MRTRATIRKAFRMTVNRRLEREYERRHNPIWPELEEALRQHGVRTYTIFRDPLSHDLFGYLEIESEERWQDLAGTEVCRRWWTYMSEIMPTNLDHSPVSWPMLEVFHLEGRPA